MWDLRLTSTLILWFIYVAYLFLRGLAFGSDAAEPSPRLRDHRYCRDSVYFAVDIAQGGTMHPSNPAREDCRPRWLDGRAGYRVRRRLHRLVARRMQLAALGLGLEAPRGRRLMAYLLAAYAVGLVLVGCVELRARLAR